MNCWCNKQLVGLMVGLVLPVGFSLLLYQGRYDGSLTYGEFLGAMFRFQSLGKLISVSVLVNLAVFFIAIWTERLLAARGIVMATLIYTVGTVVIWFLR
jgi:hypothetical protein